MADVKQLNEVLQLITNCETPPRRSFSEIQKELPLEISTKDLIAVLKKLEDDKTVIKQLIPRYVGEIKEEIAYYFASHEGKEKLQKGGYTNSWFTDLSVKKPILYDLMKILFTALVSLVIGILLWRVNNQESNKELEFQKKQIELIKEQLDSIKHRLSDTTLFKN